MAMLSVGQSQPYHTKPTQYTSERLLSQERARIQNRLLGKQEASYETMLGIEKTKADTARLQAENVAAATRARLMEAERQKVQQYVDQQERFYSIVDQDIPNVLQKDYASWWNMTKANVIDPEFAKFMDTIGPAWAMNLSPNEYAAWQRRMRLRVAEERAKLPIEKMFYMDTLEAKGRPPTNEEWTAHYAARQTPPKPSTPYSKDQAKMIDDTRGYYQVKMRVLLDEDNLVKEGMEDEYRALSDRLDEDLARIGRGETPSWLGEEPEVPEEVTLPEGLTEEMIEEYLSMEEYKDWTREEIIEAWKNR